MKEAKVFMAKKAKIKFQSHTLLLIMLNLHYKFKLKNLKFAYTRKKKRSRNSLNVSSLSFSQVYQLDVGVAVKSLKRQIWFPDVIYPLVFHPSLKY